MQPQLLASAEGFGRLSLGSVLLPAKVFQKLQVVSMHSHQRASTARNGSAEQMSNRYDRPGLLQVVQRSELKLYGGR